MQVLQSWDCCTTKDGLIFHVFLTVPFPPSLNSSSSVFNHMEFPKGGSSATMDTYAVNLQLIAEGF